jgi:hypothetical protein
MADGVSNSEAARCKGKVQLHHTGTGDEQMPGHKGQANEIRPPARLYNFFTEFLPSLGKCAPSFGQTATRMKTNIFAGWLGKAALACLAPLCASLAAEKAIPLATFAKLPINEITVFKDGHAFVAQEGSLPADSQGNILLDSLPSPVVGTFWPYSADKAARLSGVVASQRRVLIERTALTLRELLEANTGAQVLVTEAGSTNRYEATIVGVPQRSGEELAATGAPNAPERLPEKGNMVLFKTTDGIRVVGLDRVQEVTFKGGHKRVGSNEEFRDLLTLKLDWGRSRPAKSAKVGLIYLQKGVRWIPGYKVEIDGKGHAAVKLQATLLNELADLEDVSVNLVIGVPTFAFKDTLDPMALQRQLAQLSQYFQSGNGRNSLIAQNFSNAIMSQQARMSDYQGRSDEGGAGSLGPEIGDAGKTEDLFIFNVQHVTLRKGERMVLPIAEFALPYEDVFALDLPFAPPPEVRGNINNEQQRELARLFNSPKVLHKIRLSNQSKYPLTTAPALLIREGRVLAQSMMTYTSIGAKVDLAITTAIDFQVKKTELETKRTPNAIQENGSHYSRIDLTGKISVTNHRPQPAELEVTRYVLGTADTASQNGEIVKLNQFEDRESVGAGEYPYWWGWYGWPYWWSHVNGIGRITWKVKLEPKQPVDLAYEWHYFWQ